MANSNRRCRAKLARGSAPANSLLAAADTPSPDNDGPSTATDRLIPVHGMYTWNKSVSLGFSSAGHAAPPGFQNHAQDRKSQHDQLGTQHFQSLGCRAVNHE